MSAPNRLFQHVIRSWFTPISIRGLSSGTTPLPENELKKHVEDITQKFMEARELLDDAKESQGTVYFSDDMQEAKGAVRDTLEAYHSLQNMITDEQKQQVTRSIGLKMEELKAHQQVIEHPD